MTDVPGPIRIFVGCCANNEDLESQVVFEYALRKHATVPIDLTWMQLSRDPASPFYSDPANRLGWQTSNWATPFSGFRWILPELCRWKGRAIYFDPDFIPMADIAELVNQPMAPGKVVIAKGSGAALRYCCSLWDCVRAADHMFATDRLRGPDGHMRMTQYFAKHQELVQPFSGGDWNVLDVGLPADLAAPGIKAIHYTQVPTQLQLKYAVPRLRAVGQKHWYTGSIRPHPRADLQALFDALYQEALSSGVTLDQYRRAPYGKYAIRGVA